MNAGMVKFVLDNQVTEVDFQAQNLPASTTVLNYLRALPGHRGVKEGCAEGDCGACTVVLGELTPEGTIQYKAVDSCLLFLPALHGKQLITVENLATRERGGVQLHPVQQAMVEKHGSQCGFCTPGFVMALFSFYKTEQEPTRQNLVESLSGNLCRCTGYQPIIEAAHECCRNRQPDHFDQEQKKVVQLLRQIRNNGAALEIHTSSQHYMQPFTLVQALAWRKQYPEAIVIHGATDTAIRQNKTSEFAPAYLDISQVDELKEVRQEKDGYFIGSGISIEQLRDFSSVHLPEVSSLLEVFASQQIRQVATLGGNLATASPIGDLIPVVIALKARLLMGSATGKREVAAEDFFTGYRQNCMKQDELLLGIRFSAIPPDVIFRCEKVSARKDMDISSVSLCMRLTKDDDDVIQEVILAYGGMADRARRAIHVEQFLVGSAWEKEVLQAAAGELSKDFTPLSDARGSNRFRMAVAGNLLLKMFDAIASHPEKDPAYE